MFERDRPMFAGLPWEMIRSLAERARRAWKPPKSGLPKLQEECGEVIQAIGKFGYSDIGVDELALELADNVIMLAQAALIVGEYRVRAAILKKLERLAGRLRDHCRDCIECGGTGLSGAGLCPVCYPDVPVERVHVVPPPPAPPSAEWLEETFRDFRAEMPVKEWRLRVYARCVGHYLMQNGAR